MVTLYPVNWRRSYICYIYYWLINGMIIINTLKIIVLDYEANYRELFELTAGQTAILWRMRIGAGRNHLCQETTQVYRKLRESKLR
jgi:hypothetical protein